MASLSHQDLVSEQSQTRSHTPTVYESRSEAPSTQEKSVHEDSEPIIVEFAPNDPLNPLNWSRARRWYLTAASGILVLNATFASSAPSGIVPSLMKYMSFGEEVAALTVSIFVAGYCIGPLLWGPLSESVGRRPVFLVSFFVYMCFQIGCALSKNTASIIIFRFLGGTFAAAPLTNSGGVVGDIWDSKTRGTAMTVFSVAPFAGPALGPTVAGWIEVTGTSWRWLFWVLTIFSGVCLIAIFFTMPETYAPVLLRQKARQLRKETGNDRYTAPIELDKTPFSQRLNKILATPFKVLFQEPVLIALTVYISFIYGCIYLLFEAYPIVFSQGHGFNAGISGLMFLPVSLGGMVGCGVYLIFFAPRYRRYADEYAPRQVPPEKRMEPLVLAAPLYCISFFWFGWTSYSSISFWSPLMAGGLMGFSVLLIFLGVINYIVDMYLFVAASALAANTVVRSSFGAAFPLFATQMFRSMNPCWASTLLGAFAGLMVPIPFLLIRYGPILREKSKFAPSLPAVVVEHVPGEKESTSSEPPEQRV